MIADEVTRALRQWMPVDRADCDPEWITQLRRDLSAARAAIDEAMVELGAGDV